VSAAPERVRRVLGWALALPLASVASAQTSTPAITQFQIVRKELHDSHTRKDWRANLNYARIQRDLLNGSPSSRLEVARAELLLGSTAAGIAELTRYALMGQSVDPALLAPDWKALSQEHAVVRLQYTMEENRKAIGRGTAVFVLSDPRLLPEDVDYDSQTQLFYISSVREKKIIAVDARGKIQEFVQAPDDWPVLALKLDVKRGRLWATEVALQGYEFAPAADWGRSALLCFDLKHHTLLTRIEAPRASALGDMVLTRSGDVIVSDGDGGAIYRLAVNGTRLERLDRGDFISPQTAALGPDDRHLFVPDYLRGIALLDLESREVQWIPMAGRFALNGIDGLYFSQGTLIAVQNGTSPERIVAFRLRQSNREVAAEEVIERGTTTLGDPTHGVIVGDSFYYIANSGWDAIDERGSLREGAQLSSARLMRVELSQLFSDT